MAAQVTDALPFWLCFAKMILCRNRRHGPLELRAVAAMLPHDDDLAMETPDHRRGIHMVTLFMRGECRAVNPHKFGYSVDAIVIDLKRQRRLASISALIAHRQGAS